MVVNDPQIIIGLPLLTYISTTRTRSHSMTATPIKQPFSSPLSTPNNGDVAKTTAALVKVHRHTTTTTHHPNARHAPPRAARFLTGTRRR